MRARPCRQDQKPGRGQRRWHRRQGGIVRLPEIKSSRPVNDQKTTRRSAEDGTAARRSTVAGLRRDGAHVDYFCVSPSGAVLHPSWDGSWHAPAQIAAPGSAYAGGTANGAVPPVGPIQSVAASSPDPNTMYVFWVAPNGTIWSKKWTSGSWAAAEQRG